MRLAQLTYYRTNPKSATFRLNIYQRDNYTCWYCGRDLAGLDAVSANSEITVDHLTPKVRGGDESDSNLVTCCRLCNSTKGSKSLEEYRQYLANKQSPLASHLISLQKLQDALFHPSDLAEAFRAIRCRLESFCIPVVFFGERSSPDVETTNQREPADCSSVSSDGNRT